MRLKGVNIRWPLVLIGLRMGWGELRARLRGEERSIHRAALAHVKATVAPGDAAGVLAALDDFGRHRRFLMNVGDAKGPLLRALVRGLGNDARVLELGAFVGYSAVLIAANLPPGGRLVSLEMNPVAAEVARAMIAHAGLSDRVVFRCGDSADLLPKLEGPFDLVFIDHWKDVYKRDLVALEQHRMLRGGTVVVADNVGPAFDAHEYLDYVRGCGHYDTRYEKSTIEYSDMEDGVEISVFRG
jgi:catechol O-methyltransferase